MTAQQVIDCTPWRLTSPRPLTDFEWSVVYRTVETEIMGARGGLPSAQISKDAAALVDTIRKQTACPKWTTSAFGPSPAVAPYAYGCLASWWGGLAPGAAQRALGDISSGLLCHLTPPWRECPAAKRNTLFSPASQSEYGAQRGSGAPGAALTPCAQVRERISYSPMTGAVLSSLLQQMGVDAAMLALLINTTKPFILGVQMRRFPAAPLPVNPGVLDVARGIVEAVAIIGAPGVGIDITQMALSGQVDPAKLLALFNQLMPGSFGDWLNSAPELGDILPQLLQLPGWQAILDEAGDVLAQGIEERMRNPQTGTMTGNELVDRPPAGIVGELSAETKATIFIAAMAAAGIGAFLVANHLAARG